MKRKILARYIDGTASRREREQVLQWTEVSEANLAEIRLLKKSYVAGLLQAPFKEKSTKRLPVFLAVTATVAASIAILFILRTGFPQMSVQRVCSPVGQQTKVDLSDGTVVWLNSGSSIEFGDLDRQKVRKVSLVGEAFFDVRHDERHPFVVHADAFDVKVLGTRFGLNTYNSSKTVVLVEGAVEVQCCRDRHVISPGQMFSYDPELNESRISDVLTDNYVSWINGYLKFDKANLDTILSQLHSFFGVEFVYDRDSAQTTTVSGKLELRDGLDTALMNLKNSAIISYKRGDDGKVSVYISK